MTRLIKDKCNLPILIAVLIFCCGLVSGQKASSQEVSEVDGLPVLIKHLPSWETVRDSSGFFLNRGELKKALGDRPVLDLVDFTGGTEATAATYPAAKLLIVEYMTPQSATEADSKFLDYFAGNPDGGKTLYKRVGNYSVFAFDVTDQAAAGALIDEVKYQKTVQWLGEDPYLLKKLEQYFINTTRDIFIATVKWIVGGLGFSLLLGVIVGFFFFRHRQQRRLKLETYTDAGGLTRLNLDGLSE